MANSLSASFEEIWAAEQQRKFYKINVSMKIADTSFESTLRKGDTLNRPYRSDLTIQSYTRGTSITIDDLTDTNEQLSVDKQFATGFYVDDFDQIQDKYDIAARYGQDAAVLLSNQVDADVLGEAANATSNVDDGDIGGTDGNGISLTTSNVLSVFSAAKRKLQKLNIPQESLFGVVSPEVEEVLTQYGAGRDTAHGDRTQENGFLYHFYGFDLYSSNQLYTSAVLALATQPTNTDTVIINGVTFTFVTTIGTTPGNVLIGANDVSARTNLTGLINDPGTTSATQVALSTANQRVFANATATNSDANNTVTVTFKGLGVLVVSETLTDLTDEWTAALQKQHSLFGAKMAPTLVMQSMPTVRLRDVETKLGKNVLNGELYGVKTFADQADMLVSVDIASSTFSA